MAGDDAAASQGATTGADGAASGASAAEERCGPVAVRRYVKPDGRALLIFRRVDSPSGESEAQP